MIRYLVLSIMLLTGLAAFTQSADSAASLYTNAADNLLLKDHKLLVGGYGEVHYNQAMDGENYQNGQLDVHRMVMLFGYNFDKRTQFITELEFEHVSEVYVEQAFLQYKLSNSLSFRGGLMLVPMGIINEYHEPTTFNGVERPLIDQRIAPTTWREIGFGITGHILPASLKYQAYVMNGFNGFDGSARLNGNDGLRKGRQKGAESYVSSPNLAGKMEYFGVRGLNIGLSGYIGKTQSTLYDGVSRKDADAIAMADSSVVGVSMLGLDARFTSGGLQVRAQLYLTGLSNTAQYNVFTADPDGHLNDVGNTMIGYYAEAGYNVLRFFDTDKQLHPFVRYAFLNTHHSVEDNISINKGYEKTAITTGITLALSRDAVVKADVQFVKSGGEEKFAKVFNAGIGVMF